MALTFECEDPRGMRGSKRMMDWHYGEPMPEWVLQARVVKFTADGDELDLLLGAISATIKPVKTIDVTSGAAPQLTEGTNENPDR